MERFLIGAAVASVILAWAARFCRYDARLTLMMFALATWVVPFHLLGQAAAAASGQFLTVPTQLTEIAHVLNFAQPSAAVAGPSAAATPALTFEWHYLV